MKKSQAHGFTIIELLVVVAIIVLLSSVVLVTLNRSFAKSRDASRMKELRTMQDAVERYAVDNGGDYPTTAGSWVYDAGCTGGSADFIPDVVAARYIPVLPRDPKPLGTATGCYGYNSDGADYMILASLTVETFDPEDESHPMDRQSANEQSIAVWSEGAVDW